MSTSGEDNLLNDCGCCQTDSLAFRRHDNRPGQREIKYRLDTHGGFVHRMLARLSRDQLPSESDPRDRRPLAGLTIRSNDDPAIALLDAWGMVADVLSFYQERIANEGFMRTATERRSVLELARAIGYELNPGVAASTYLAFTADKSPGSPAFATVAKGTQVLSIPDKDEVPQTFETTMEIIARAEWNALKPYTLITSDSDPLVVGTKQIRLKGINTGLKAGDGILIVGNERTKSPLSDHWGFRILLSVVPAEDGESTRVTWEQGLDHLLPSVSLDADEITVYAFRLRTSLFGKNAPQWSTLSHAAKADYVAGLMGAASKVSVAKKARRIVSAGSNNTLHIWTYSANEENWLKENITVSGVGTITCVAFSPDGKHLLLGHADGALNLLHESEHGWKELPLPESSVAHDSEVARVAFSLQGELALSIDVDNSAKTWQVKIRTRKESFTPRMRVNVGQTSYRVGSGERRLTLWKLSSTWHETTVAAQAHEAIISRTAISSDGKKIVSAAADGTLKIWHQLGNSWRGQLFSSNGNEPAHGAPISCVAFSADDAQVLSLAIDGQSRIWSVADRTLLGTYLDDTLDYLSEWPDFDLRVDETMPLIHLRDQATTILQHSWVVLSKPDYAQVYNIKQAVTDWHEEFTISGEITRLELDTPEHLIRFGRRETVVFAQSEPLALYQEPVPHKLPIEGKEIELDQLTPGLEAERRVVISGKRMRARVIDTEQLSPLLSSTDNISSRVLENNDVLFVVARPVLNKEGYTLKWLAKDEGFMAQVVESSKETIKVRWILQDRKGFNGTLMASPDKILLIPADKDDITSSEVMLIDEIFEQAHHQRNTINSMLRFSTALHNIYDHDTVSINANVVPATQGETMLHEIMGSGDGTRINQRFVLNKTPLTYVSAATASGAESTLEVRINEVLWKPVSSLYAEGPRSQRYLTRHDNDGNAMIIFGDGRKGARLPTGQENITARYRSGIGPEGEVAAESLRLLKSKPLGIRDVTNPLAASGAAAPEVLDDARAHAPLTVLTLDRIVSVNDFEDFVSAFSGIGKAQARVLWNGETNVIHITIATASGDTVRLKSSLYENLLAAMNRVRDTTVQVLVNGYVELHFKVEAQILIDSRYLWQKVQASVKRTLNAAFTFKQRAFGQDVSEVEVLTLILGVEGVIAAELCGDKLKITEAGVKSETYPQLEMIHLRAAKARWDPHQPGATIGAQLLLISPAHKGIILKEVAS